MALPEIQLLEKKIVVPVKNNRYISFPTIIAIDSNTLMMAYRDAFYGQDNAPSLAGEHGLAGDIYIMYSYDGGETWEDEILLYDSKTTGENEQHGILSKDKDQDIYLVSRQFGEYFNVYIAKGIEAVTSPFGGKGIGKDRRVISIKGDFSFWTVYGKIIDGYNNELLLPIYGIERENVGKRCISSSGFLRSFDKGDTWHFGEYIGRPSLHNISFNETTICRLEPDTFLAVMRTDNLNEALYTSISYDNGITWTTPEQLSFRGDAPYFYLLDCGCILLCYRGFNKDGSYGWHVSISKDRGRTWVYAFSAGRYQGSKYDGGYGDMAGRGDNKIVGVYYASDMKRNTFIEEVILEIKCC